MKHEKIESYIKAIPILAAQVYTGMRPPADLLQFIDTTKNAIARHAACNDFFSGEEAFYQQFYEKALKHYLKATSIPHFHFFCYRTSAYLFDDAGNKDKALGFARKALKIYPDDFPTLLLLDKLLKGSEQIEEVFEIRQKIKLLEKEAFSKLSSEKFEEKEPEKIEFAEIATQTSTGAKNSEFFQNNPFNPMELPMNTESDIFSSPRSEDPSQIQALTKRLYSPYNRAESHDPYLPKEETPPDLTAYEELKRLASSSQNLESTKNYIANEMGLDLKALQALEHQIKSFQLSQTEAIHNYLELAKSRPKQHDFSFHYLNGWPYSPVPPTPYNQQILLTETSRRATGGLFIRWNGKGIAINPGPSFLHHFHQQGLHIRDINFIVVTGDQRDCYADVKEIYDLNYQLNKASPELQIIHYYFNQKAFQDLSHYLKPHFKQERNTLHCLELFVDSPDVEKIDLAEGITLHYFSTSSRDAYIHQESKEERSGRLFTNFGIRLDLKASSQASSERNSVKIGYLAHTAWNPLLAHHLGHCDLLITAFGNTNPNDYNKISYNQDSLGYYGIYTLMEEVLPRLLLCGEFEGREGDIRVEAAQKLRIEYSKSSALIKNAPAVLPADIGLLIDLLTFHIQCSVSDEWVDPSQVKVVKTARAFGQLEYLSPSCCY